MKQRFSLAGEARYCWYDAGNSGPVRWGNFELKPGFRIDPETGRPTSREIPEGQLRSERMTNAIDARKKFMKDVQKAEEIMRKLPEGRRKAEMARTVSRFYEEGEKRIAMMDQNYGNVSSGVFEELSLVIENFRREINVDKNVYDQRILDVYKTQTDARKKALDATEDWMAKLLGAHILHAVSKLLFEGRECLRYVDHELRFLTQNFGETQKDRVVKLKQWKSQATRIIAIFDVSIGNTENLMQSLTEEKSYLEQGFRPGEMGAGSRYLEVSTHIDSAKKSMEAQQLALFEKITNINYQPTRVEAQKDFDDLQTLTAFWRREDPTAYQARIQEMRPVYTILRKKMTGAAVTSVRNNREMTMAIEQSNTDTLMNQTRRFLTVAEDDPTKPNAEHALQSVTIEKNHLLSASTLTTEEKTRLGALKNEERKWQGFLATFEQLSSSIGAFKAEMQQDSLDVGALNTHLRDINTAFASYAILQTRRSSTQGTQFESQMNEQLEAKGVGVRLKFDGWNKFEWVLSE